MPQPRSEGKRDKPHSSNMTSNPHEKQHGSKKWKELAKNRIEGDPSQVVCKRAETIQNITFIDFESAFDEAYYYCLLNSSYEGIGEEELLGQC